MPANVPNPGLYLDGVAATLTGIRDLFRKCQDKIGYINAMGGRDFLIAAYPDGLGLDGGAADGLIAALNQHAALAGQYQGGEQAPKQDYMANGQPFWGGN